MTRSDAGVACGLLLALLDVCDPTTLAAVHATQAYGLLIAAVSPTDRELRQVIAAVRADTHLALAARRDAGGAPAETGPAHAGA